MIEVYRCSSGLSNSIKNEIFSKRNIKYSLRNYRELKSRSSHQRCSMKKGFLRNFSKFAGKHMSQSLFFNKVAGLRPVT